MSVSSSRAASACACSVSIQRQVGPSEQPVHAPTAETNLTVAEHGQHEV